MTGTLAEAWLVCDALDRMVNDTSERDVVTAMRITAPTVQHNEFPSSTYRTRADL